MSGGDTGNDIQPREPAKPVGEKGGSGAGGGGQVPDSGDPCSIVEKTFVNSPNRNVAGTVRVNDVLVVRFRPGPPSVLEVVAQGGAVLGSLTPPSMPQLMACSRSGRSYAATVTSIQGGRVEVRIEPK